MKSLREQFFSVFSKLSSLSPNLRWPWNAQFLAIFYNHKRLCGRQVCYNMSCFCCEPVSCISWLSQFFILVLKPWVCVPPNHTLEQFPQLSFVKVSSVMGLSLTLQDSCALPGADTGLPRSGRLHRPLGCSLWSYWRVSSEMNNACRFHLKSKF